jgi:UDPglucose--hexose-1-phosphate uridylyltransferase
MSRANLRIDPLTGAYVVVTPWRQRRPQLPERSCPFCPGGLEAPGPYDVRHIPNRWPGLPDGCHEVILHGPDHNSSFPAMGEKRAAQVVELWAARTAALAARDDVAYVFIFENRGRAVGATIDHPHSQILAFSLIPPIPAAELSAGGCGLCQDPAEELMVTRCSGWRAQVPWAPSWPYEMLISPGRHVADLPAADPQLRTGLGVMLGQALTRMERLLGSDAPYLLWVHQRPACAGDWPAAHLHLHLAPVLRAPGLVRHLAAAELGAGVFFDPVEPAQAAARLRSPPKHLDG